ncbi:hypothetical protein BE15_15545 [Sorangium cellulosum]|uniref:Uncharacterized protein n=1 Tax=Sorangium cellulosum TaxID=56 RepID=A0A150QBW9_SORCE|nr:hypothetical protein BE15_15545 [Sorangium cellulosum]
MLDGLQGPVPQPLQVLQHRSQTPTVVLHARDLLLGVVLRGERLGVQLEPDDRSELRLTGASKEEPFFCVVVAGQTDLRHLPVLAEPQVERVRSQLVLRSPCTKTEPPAIHQDGFQLELGGGRLGEEVFQCALAREERPRTAGLELELLGAQGGKLEQVVHPLQHGALAHGVRADQHVELTERQPHVSEQLEILEVCFR